MGRQPRLAEETSPVARVYLRPLAFQVPRSLHQALGRYADDNGTTRTAVILAAVNATHSKLPVVLATLEPAGGGVNDLYAVPQQRPRDEPRTEVRVRVTDAQLEALDRLAADLRTNRSKVVTQALRLYLPPV